MSYIEGGWPIEVRDEVTAWLATLDWQARKSVVDAIRLLSAEGPKLGRPFVDTLAGTRLKNLKELRPGSSGRMKIRILFAFDPVRQAILLLAGDKAGDWNRWYERNIPIAERRFAEHVAQLKEEGRL